MNTVAWKDVGDMHSFKERQAISLEKALAVKLKMYKECKLGHNQTMYGSTLLFACLIRNSIY